ncbi:unnamed protein product [Musa textilis]
MWVGGVSTRRIVKEVFRDFRGRRAGLIKALTTDFQRFDQQCDTGEISPPFLCLCYGY